MTIENGYLLLADRRVATGDLVIEGDTIARIVERPCAPERVVMPGLVNCHGHTAMTLVRGLGSGLPLKRWLEEAIFPVEAKMTPEDVRAGTLWGSLEMLAGGTTSVADMYDFPAACEEAFAAAGVKASANRVGLAFQDNVPPNRFDECVAYVKRGCEVRLNRDFCLHSEYLTNEKFVRAIAEANREFKRPVHVHVSETKSEHEECLRRHGKTPIAYLADLGVFDYGGYAAHCVWCTDDDFRRMAAKGVTLIHNPTSNMKLGSGFARIARAQALGVNVALGTDGCASNDNLDLFEEMHVASLIAKGLACDPTALPAWDVIEMATKNGARALGRTDTGTLAVGQKADLCVATLDRLHLIPHPSSLIPNLIVNSMHGSDVEMTIVDGVVRYDRGQFPGIDLSKARAEFLSAVGRLFNTESQSVL